MNWYKRFVYADLATDLQEVRDINTLKTKFHEYAPEHEIIQEPDGAWDILNPDHSTLVDHEDRQQEESEVESLRRAIILAIWRLRFRIKDR